MTSRRERLRLARLYLVVETAGLAAARAALAGGVDMVQLREKQASDSEILRAAVEFRRTCEVHGALFWLNDRPDLAKQAGADGVHIGQEDMSIDEARSIVGPDVLIGLSTHSADQFDAALESDADQLSVGPVWETPTKQGRPAAGLDYVRYAASRGGRSKPWFAIGGIDPGNVRDVLAAGAERIVVVRAIRDAGDPRAAAEALRAALDQAAPGGSAE